MIEFAQAEWGKSKNSLKSAIELMSFDFDSSSSRAYYAAFHAVTALFAIDGKSFSKHSALRSAVHRDLIRTDIWDITLGMDYDFLLDVREIGDYGGIVNVSLEDANKAVECAERILNAVLRLKNEHLR